MIECPKENVKHMPCFSEHSVWSLIIHNNENMESDKNQPYFYVVIFFIEGGAEHCHDYKIFCKDAKHEQFSQNQNV